MTKDIITQDKNNMLLALEKKGLNDDIVAEKILELLDWEEVKVDKNGNSYVTKDGNLRLKAIELLLKLKAKPTAANNHLHVTEGVLDKLLRGQEKPAKGEESK